MSKTAFLFPGQGSQAVGMGLDLYKNFKVAQRTFEEAEDTLGIPLKKLCFQGPEDELKLTFNAQPAILTVSTAAYRVFAQLGVKSHGLAGHSLGEFTALVAGGVIDFADGVKLVHLRGELMEQAVPHGFGGMAAVIGMEPDKVDRICRQVKGVLEVANSNCPGQIVVSGEMKALKEGMRLLEEAGAQRVVPLRVSGPFHSSLMESAAHGLKEALAEVQFNEPTYPIYVNVNGTAVRNPGQLKWLLVRQVTHPVQWQRTMENMLRDGFDTFIAMGEGRILSSFVRAVDRSLKVHQVTNSTSLRKTIEGLDLTVADERLLAAREE